MSKSRTKKKVVVSSENGATSKVTPTASRRGSRSSSSRVYKQETLLFEKPSYTYMIVGAVLVVLGMMMMLGGSMPDVNTWDPDIIYSFRITVIGPILILAGLIIEIFAIFKK